MAMAMTMTTAMAVTVALFLSDSTCNDDVQRKIATMEVITAAAVAVAMAVAIAIAVAVATAVTGTISACSLAPLHMLIFILKHKIGHPNRQLERPTRRSRGT